MFSITRTWHRCYAETWSWHRKYFQKSVEVFFSSLDLKVYAVGKFLKGSFPAISWSFKVAGKMLRHRMYERHTLTYIDYLYF